MQSVEKLKPTEVISNLKIEAIDSFDVLDQSFIDNLYEGLGLKLQGLVDAVSLKFYHQITEKLAKEKSQYEQLLNLQDLQKEELSHYSFVLNSYYFEQRFLEEEV